MLVKEVQPGEVVIAHGWDIATTLKQASETIGYLIPHGMNHKAAVEAGHSISLLYIGPTIVKLGSPSKDIAVPTRKMHNFLTESGDIVALEGYEFRHLHPVSFVK